MTTSKDEKGYPEATIDCIRYTKEGTQFVTRDSAMTWARTLTVFIHDRACGVIYFSVNPKPVVNCFNPDNKHRQMRSEILALFN